MNKPFRSHVVSAVVAASLAAAFPARADVTLSQTLTLARGWNAVYAEVAPTQPLDEVFADWPVESVGFYDPASFLATRQFGARFDTGGLSMDPVAEWHRNYPEVANAASFPAGTVLLAFNTNQAPASVSLRGVPAAPRITWHVTDTNEVMNFVGFSLQAGASVLPGDYLEGFDGNVQKGGFHRIAGTDAGSSPAAGVFSAYASKKVSDGQVLLVASDVQSDWSGALFVAPMTGPDFGGSGTRATLSVRNDGAGERTVDVALLRPQDVGERAGSWGDIDLPDAALRLRDAAVAHTNAAWNALAPENGTRRIASKLLAPGETWRLELGLDRAALPSAVKGAPFGALLRVTDADGGSKMRVDVPLVGTASGADAALTAWPAGLWVADVALDTVTAPGASAGTPTGGRAKIRLPVHVDGTGAIRLLQRVVAAGETASDGTLSYRLYAGTAAVPDTATAALRLSSVVLPTETPVVEADAGGSLREGATFRFAVAADGATSLLRHPLHPQHDGLRWDFSTPAPSGDDPANYKGDVKPETFSVSCRIDLSLAMDGGEAAWNPEGTKSGTCRWTFSNLMRQGDVVLSGPMTVKRVSPIADLVLE